MHKLIKHSITSLISLVTGFFICLGVKKFTDFKLLNSISINFDPFEIFSVIITVLLAIYVTRSLSQKNEKEKEERLLLTRYYIDFKERLFKIIENIEFSTIKTNSDLKIIRKKLNSVIELSEKNNFIESNNEINKNLKEELTDIWELVTDGITEKQDAENKNTILERKNKIDCGLIKIEELIFNIIMKINKK